MLTVPIAEARIGGRIAGLSHLLSIIVQTTGSSPQYLDRLLNALQRATAIDYAAYQVMVVSLHMQMTAGSWQEVQRRYRSICITLKLAMPATSV